MGGMDDIQSLTRRPLMLVQLCTGPSAKECLCAASKPHVHDGDGQACAEYDGRHGITASTLPPTREVAEVLLRSAAGMPVPMPKMGAGTLPAAFATSSSGAHGAHGAPPAQAWGDACDASLIFLWHRLEPPAARPVTCRKATRRTKMAMIPRRSMCQSTAGSIPTSQTFAKVPEPALLHLCNAYVSQEQGAPLLALAA